MHLTYMPRKPTSLGIMLKTVADSESRVLLNMELVEPKEVMMQKEFTPEIGANCGAN